MANSFVQPIEPWRLPDSEGINTSINDTDNSLFDLIYPDYSAVSDATMFQDNYMNTGTQTPPQSMMSMYVDENTFTPENYADDVEVDTPNYEDLYAERTTDSNVPEKEGFNWGSAIADGLMGYADALSNEYQYAGFGSREGNTRERLMRGRPSQAYRTGSSY